MRVLMLLIALVAAGPRRRAAAPPVSPLESARSVLFVGAHPDDEVPIAPWLAKKCIEEQARCSLLIVTNGDHAIRSVEMRQSAAFFGAQLTHWDLPEGTSWIGVVERVRAHVDAVDPDVVITFDPRHGTTGHPDHRAIGQAVIDAIGGRESLYLIETRIDIALSPLSIVFSAADVHAWRVERFDATSRWSALLHVMEIHRSQFPEPWIAQVAASPLRAVFFASYP